MISMTDYLVNDIQKLAMYKLAACAEQEKTGKINVSNPMGGSSKGSKVKLPDMSPNMAPPINDLIPKVQTMNSQMPNPQENPLLTNQDLLGPNLSRSM